MKNSATYREIMQQPAIWRGWADDFGPKLAELRGWISAQNPDEIWLCGAGTSAYIGDLIAAALGADPRRIRAISTTDLVACPQNYIRKGLRPLVISFGRSGNSAESLGTLDLLDSFLPEAPRLNITCNGESALATRPAAHQKAIILPAATHDAGFAMTSSYSTMLLTAILLLDEGLTPAHLTSLADRAEALLPAYFEAAQAMPRPERVVFTGSGPLAFAAREASLKVMELAAGDIPAIWDSNLGFRHGPKSFVNTDTKVFVFLSNHALTGQYDRDLAAEVRDQFGPETVLSLGADGDIAVPPTGNEVMDAVLFVLFSQALAVTWSHALGLNIDDPFKGRGTLTRVVSGVTLHTPEAL
ncbi:MAG: SIS domain-containing protein [Rhodobacteraceae bacterium]|nr:SIS domain-containing protein [Paracoccaceae bacterium]